jgi:hypothetical protein
MGCSNPSRHCDDGWSDCFAAAAWQQHRVGSSDGRLHNMGVTPPPPPRPLAAAPSMLTRTVASWGSATRSPYSHLTQHWPTATDTTRPSRLQARPPPPTVALRDSDAPSDWPAVSDMPQSRYDRPQPTRRPPQIRFDDVFPVAQPRHTEVGAARDVAAKAHAPRKVVAGSTGCPAVSLDDVFPVESPSARVPSNAPDQPSWAGTASTASTTPSVQATASAELTAWLRHMRRGRQPTRPSRSKDDPLGCVICFLDWDEESVRPAFDSFIVCGHGANMCKRCAAQVSICPFCRAPK